MSTQGTLLPLPWWALTFGTHGHRSGRFKKYRYSGLLQRDSDSVVCDGFLTFGFFFSCVSNVGTTDSIHHLEPLWTGQVGRGNEGRLKSRLRRVGETVVFLPHPPPPPGNAFACLLRDNAHTCRSDPATPSHNWGKADSPCKPDESGL